MGRWISVLPFLFLLLPMIVIGQRIHSVTDPDLKFTVTLPDGWQVIDDGLNLMIFPPEGKVNEYVDLTYYEILDNTLDQHFEMAINMFYPMNEPKFEVIKQGRDTVGNAPARWVQFNSWDGKEDVTSIYYMFVQNDQVFKVRGVAWRDNFEQYVDDFRRIIRSIRSRKI